MEFAFFGGSKLRFSERFSHHLHGRSVELPGGLHELDEVVVVVDGRANGGVVLLPLGGLDFAIAVAVTEVLEELQEDLVLGELTVLDLGVHGAVVDALKVSGGDVTITVSIELKEGLSDHSHSLVVEFSLYQSVTTVG